LTGHGIVFLRLAKEINLKNIGINRITSNEDGRETDNYQVIKDKYFECVERQEKEELMAENEALKAEVQRLKTELEERNDEKNRRNRRKENRFSQK